MTRVLTCGVLVTDGVHLLIGHATRSPRWDIPKGVADPAETPEQAARRELLEETGLTAPAVLADFGQHAYLPHKDLALFAWQLPAMPDPAALVCRSTFLINGHELAEFDRFECPMWSDALPKVGKSMRSLLAGIARVHGWLRS